MKLFTKRESILLSDKRQTDDIAQVAYLKDVLRKLQERINTENNNFTLRLQEQRDAYASERKELRKEFIVLSKALFDLKEKRKELMIPVDTLKKQNEDIQATLLNKLDEAEKKERHADDLTETLTQKLDELSSRESIIETTEQELSVKKDGIEAESKMVSDGHVRLNAMLQDFQRELEAKTKSITDREKACELREALLIETTNNHTQELIKRETALQDKELALERAYKQITK